MEGKNERLVGNVSIENLTIHFDNNNFYGGDPWDPCDCMEECDDEGRDADDKNGSTDDTDNIIALNMDKVAESVARETNVPLGTVSKVLDSETSILKKLGIVETSEEDGVDTARGNAAKHEKTAEEAENEAENDAGKDPDDDISDEVVENFLNEVFGELMPSIAGTKSSEDKNPSGEKKSSGEKNPSGRNTHMGNTHGVKNPQTVRWNVRITKSQSPQVGKKGDGHGNEN